METLNTESASHLLLLAGKDLKKKKSYFLVQTYFCLCWGSHRDHDVALCDAFPGSCLLGHRNGDGQVA